MFSIDRVNVGVIVTSNSMKTLIITVYAVQAFALDMVKIKV